MQVQIKFTKSGANAAFGGFSPGDVARVSKDLAAHFVNDAGVAVYAEKQKHVEAVAAETDQNPADAPKRKGKK